MTQTDSRIKRLRLALKWSQARMAEHIGLTQASVSAMENGARESGPVSKLLDQLESQVLAAPQGDQSADGAAA